jgi:type IV pilus assembly protein PilB
MHLSEAGLVEYDRAVAVLADRQYASMTPDRALVAAGMVAEEDLARLLSELYGLPYVSLKERQIPPEVLNLLPRQVAENYAVVPVERKNGVVVLAMADPLDVVAEDAVRFLTSCDVERVVSTRSEILSAVHQERNGAAGQPAVAAIGGIIGKLHGEATELQVDQIQEEEDRKDDEPDENAAPVIQLVNALLSDAITMKASDIHIEPFEDCVRVRYRIDGVLQPICELPKSVQNACIARTKLISNMDISEKRRPQDGRTRIRVGNRKVDLRVNSLPCFHGEKIVLRILDKEAGLLNLEMLGFLPRDLELFRGLIHNSQGMVVITGPTGSGKTSTLYAALNELNRVSENIITVEDPVEFQLKGIAQCQINPRAGLTFASALRAILRQDPDIVMLGEIRDLETAEIAFQAAQTGHFVLSTLHTNSAAASITRLGHMGVPAFLTAASLLGVVAQRLVRKICPNCKVEAEADAHLLRFLDLAGAIARPRRYFKGQGCDACGMSGYKGRAGLYEVLPVNDRIKDLIFAEASELDMTRAAVEDGMHTLLMDGLLKVEEGMTTLNEVLRVVTIDRKAGGAEE